MTEYLGHAHFPSWSLMISTDVLILLLALAGTVVVIINWRGLREAGAAPGIVLILAGLWTGGTIYLTDFYTMVVLPSFVGMADAMAAMEGLHFDYSWYINTAAAVLILTGLILTILRIVRQIGVLRERTRSLQESQSLLNSIFENVPVALLIKDRNHVVERPNRTYEEWYGVKVDEMLGRRSEDAEDFQPADDATAMNAQEQEVLSTGRTLYRQIERKFADGRTHVIGITKFPVYDQDGTITKVGSVSIDLTERVRAEEAAKAAVREAERANKAKSDFLAAMSHDLRTPLNAILGFSEILSGQYFGPIDDRYRDYADDIHFSGEMLLELVNDLLDFSTLEAGRKTLARERVPAAGIVEECTKLVEDRIVADGLTLEITVPPDAPDLHVDRRAVKQILINLLSNSAKFTPEGGDITIEVVPGTATTQIVVTDTGVGIAPELLPTITDPFARDHHDAYRSEDGWGLGLSITKSLIQLHGGEMEIESAPGRGTRVTVSLPNAE